MKMKSKNGRPFCLLNVIKIVKSTTPAAMEGLQVECDNCGARGPIDQSKEGAIAGWEHGTPDLEGKRQRSN
jgi:hypothetical protein